MLIQAGSGYAVAHSENFILVIDRSALA